MAAFALALVGLATGAALVVYFIAGVSMGLALAIVITLIAATALMTWSRLRPDARQEFRTRVWAGARAGVPALLAYDVSRMAIVRVADLGMNPFEAIPLFGQLLVGAGAPSLATSVVGVAFHAANGIGFGIAYTVVAGERGPVAGVLWGLGLEAAMLTFYPGWLDIRAVQEFVSVSILGHVAYGATLGWVARHLLASSRLAGATSQPGVVSDNAA
jgi:hypothetical protein